MNQKQKLVLFFISAIICLMILFPPFVVLNYKQVIIKTGYGFLFDLPPYILTTSNGTIPATVNVATLLVQLLGTLIVGGLLYIALKK